MVIKTQPLPLFRFRTPILLVMVVLGTLVRLAYGWRHQPWQEAPDQLAWQMLVEEARSGDCCSYDQWVHYPHEGGTVISSGIAMVLGKISRYPGLALAALLLDSLSRLLQLLIVRRHFPAKVYYAFAAWTVLGMPYLLPWGTVNYGLHSLAAFVPFVLLHFALQPEVQVRRSLLQGALVGLCIWFCYDAVVLLPVFLFAMVFRKGNVWARWAFLPTLLAVLALHVLVRNVSDAGFHLQDLSLGTVRGVGLQQWGQDLTRLGTVWWESLPGSMGMQQTLPFLATYLLLLGAFAMSLASKRSLENGFALHASLLILCFALAYALSPFYFGKSPTPHYASYRHWSFVLPLLSLVAFSVLLRTPRGYLTSAIFLLCTGTGSINFYLLPPQEGYHAREAGHVLGTKLGHDPQRLARIAMTHPGHQEHLLQGMGWGMTQALLGPASSSEQQMDELMQLIHQFPPHQQRQVEQGVVYAFSEWTNPRLPLSQLSQLHVRYPELQGVPVVR